MKFKIPRDPQGALRESPRGPWGRHWYRLPKAAAVLSGARGSIFASPRVEGPQGAKGAKGGGLIT